MPPGGIASVLLNHFVTSRCHPAISEALSTAGFAHILHRHFVHGRPRGVLKSWTLKLKKNGGFSKKMFDLFGDDFWGWCFGVLFGWCFWGWCFGVIVGWCLGEIFAWCWGDVCRNHGCILFQKFDSLKLFVAFRSFCSRLRSEWSIPKILFQQQRKRVWVFFCSNNNFWDVQRW